MNSPNISIGGSVNAQTVAFGDMYDSANAAVQQLERSNEGAAQTLQQVLAMLAASNVQDGRVELAQAVDAVAKSPSAENKRGLIDRIKAFGTAASVAGTAVVGIDKLIDDVQALKI